MGQMIKGYELIEQIGSSTLGTVYRAYQSTLGREVAVRIVLPGLANQPDFIRRFEAEAQLIARLEHPYIVPLFDYWRDTDGAYLVMRWLRGGNVAGMIREGPLDLASAARLLDQVASALAAAHAAGVVHGDLKPSNILLDEEGNGYLTDFGIAGPIPTGGGTALDAEMMLGLSDYVSPEQARGLPLTPASDIYSLGVALLEILTGAKTAAKLLLGQRTFNGFDEPNSPIESVDDTVRDRLDQVFRQAIANDPRQRYSDPLAFAADFRAAARLDDNPQDLVEALTLREQTILRLISDGQSNREIAAALFIEISTVKWYIRQTYRKLGVRSRRQAMLKARELDLLVSGADSTGKPTISEIASPPVILANPYKGLHAFEAVDRKHFFGREEQVQHLLRRLESSRADSRFLMIIGPSGSGKSSLIRAGVVPALQAGEISGSERWFVVQMTPGTKPLDELEIALIRVAANQVGNIREQLERDHRGLVRAVDLLLPQDGSELLLVVDQLEELFTLVSEEERRSQFLNLLTTAATDPRSRVRVITALRADYYDRPLQVPAFGVLVPDNMETVLPLSAEQLERAIVQPVAGTGATFEAGLVATILDDMLYQPGALPLLQYALTELFEEREDRILTHRAYTAIGRATGALARQAEELYLEQDEIGRETTRQLFLRLVSVDARSDGQVPTDTRRSALRSELIAISPNADLVDEITEAYAAYRLLTLDHDPVSRLPTVEVAHEALLREWGRLREWIGESRDDISQHRRLQILTEEWLAAEREPGLLLREKRLDQFAAWTSGTSLALTNDEQSFLTASLIAREDRLVKAEEQRLRELDTAHKLATEASARAEEKSRSNLLLRRLAVGLATLLLITAGLAALAVRQSQLTQEQARLSRSRELAAGSQLQLERDPELSILLAMAALDEADTSEALGALHQAVGNSRLENSLLGHSRLVYWLNLSPNGRYLVSSGWDGSRMWDLASGRMLEWFPGYDIVFGPDGTRIVTTTRDEENRRVVLHSWDSDSFATQDSSQVSGFEAREGQWLKVINDDLTQMAIGYEDGFVELWDIRTGERLHEWSAHSGRVTDLVFSPDESRLAAVATDIAVWDTKIGNLVARVPALSPDISNASSVGFSDNGRLLAANSPDKPGDIVFWDLSNVAEGETPEQLQTLIGHTNLVNSFAFSADGQLLATGSQDNTARLWAVSELSTTPLTVLAGHRGGAKSVALVDDGQRLISGDMQGDIRVWDIALSTGKELFARDIGANVFRIASDPTSGRLAATGLDGSVQMWTENGLGERQSLPGHETMAYEVAFSPDGSRLATSGAENRTIVWDLESQTALFELAGHEDGISAGIFPNLQAIAYSLDGRLLATGGAQGHLLLWDADTGQELQLPNSMIFPSPDSPAPIVSLLFSPDGRYLVAGGDSEVINVFDVSTGEVALTLETGFRSTGLSFDQVRQYLAVGNWDGELTIFDFQESVTTGSASIVAHRRGHDNFIVNMAHSPDGQHLVSVSLDGDTKVWSADNAELHFTLKGSGAGVMDAAISADGNHLVTSDLSGMLHAYTLDSDELKSLALSRLSRWWRLDECELHLHETSCPSAPMNNGLSLNVSHPDQVIGVWRKIGDSVFPYVAFAAEGMLTAAPDIVVLDADPPLTATYEFDGGQMVVTNELCGSAPGVYSLRLLDTADGNKRLVATLETDPCAPRWGVLAGEYEWASQTN